MVAQINDPLVTLTVGAVATVLNPSSNTPVIYAGLGEPNAVSNLMTPSTGATQFYGTGIIKSTDLGNTWTLLGGNGASNIFYRAAIRKIVTVPNNPNIVYAAVSIAKNGVTGNQGIYASTDGGQTWTNTTAAAGLPNNLQYSDLVMNPANPSVLYAAIGESAGNNANGVYITTNGGQTWQKMTNLPFGSQAGTGTVGRITLAISPTLIAGTSTYALYAAFMATNTTPGNAPASPPNTVVGNLYQLGYVPVNGTSADLSATWKVIWGKHKDTTAQFLLPSSGSPFNYVGVQGYYDTSLIVDPTEATNIFAGGQDNFLWIRGAINSSQASPATVTDIAGGFGPKDTTGNTNNIHVDHHGIAVNPTGSQSTPFTVPGRQRRRRFPV